MPNTHGLVIPEARKMTARMNMDSGRARSRPNENAA
jgi:hypothetical protein